MISCMVENAVFWINTLPVNSGMSCTISPWMLMTGTNIDFKKHYKIEFGAYAEAQEATFPRNSPQSRTEPDICIGPTGNLQGSHWFLKLRTRRRIKQRTITPIPIPARVIDRVHALANADN